MPIYKRSLCVFLACSFVAIQPSWGQALNSGGLDLSKLPIDQLNSGQQATSSRAKQMNPVSAPMRQLPPTTPVPGFNTLPLPGTQQDKTEDQMLFGQGAYGSQRYQGLSRDGQQPTQGNIGRLKGQDLPSPDKKQLQLRPFGEELFSGGVVPFSATSDMPVPLDYIVGAGDTIELRLFGKENKSFQLIVDRTGAVTVPEIGPVVVAGLSFESAGKALLERISKQKIGVEATVSMGALRSIQVFLMGDVNNPGAYATDSLTTVVNALLIGGGLKPTGSMRKIEIRRKGAVVARIDLYDAILRGGDKGNIRLQSGDTIFVPAVGRRVGVGGEVLRPAIYELAGEKTADEVIHLAGGMLPTAYAAQAKLDRVGQDGSRQVVDVALTSAIQRKFELKDGDVLSIPSVVARWDKSITLSGSVDRPGSYEWKQGMHLASLIRSIDSLAREAYRPLAIIERTDVSSGTHRFFTANLLNVIEGKTQEPLQAADRVIVLSQTDVEFLSSANVQFVLSGRLPPEDNNGKTGVVIKDKKTQDQAEQANLKSRALDAVDDRPKQQMPNLQQMAQANSTAQTNPMDPDILLMSKQAQPECRGLVELSDVIHREGTERFRAAILSSSGDSDKSHLVKNVNCPKIFQEVPDLLSFVLENSITVRGEVKQPGVLPIPDGLPLEIALNARGGMTREADKSGAELSRLSPGKLGRSVLKRHLVKPEEFAKVTLEPGNLVLVRKRFSEMESGVVRLGGEFAHPGNYEIRRGEKFSELIARAGGITPQSYPQGTVFLRQSIKEEKKQYYQKASLDLQNTLLLAMTRNRAGGASSVDAGAGAIAMGLVNQMRNMDPVGRMVVEADPTVLQVRPELDVVLEAGDEIFVPRRPSSILVMGEVLNPGAVQFQSGKKAADYVDAVGGLSQLADANRVFAILPNGSAEPVKMSSWNFQPTLLPPGSVIYVSRDSLPTSNMDLLFLSLQVFKDLALSAASLSVISK